MSKPNIRRILAEETIPIRLAILREGLPRHTAIFAGDDDPETQHFGAFENDALLGVASIYLAPLPERPARLAAWQLRGMATLPEARGRGFGRALLNACVAIAAAQGGTLAWCNARRNAVGFYQCHGWRLLSDEFDIPTAGPHFRMAIELPVLGSNQ